MDADTGYLQRRQLEGLPREALEELQLEKLNLLLSRVLPQGGFYASKLGSESRKLQTLAELQELPFTTKDELAPNVGSEAEEFPIARNHTYSFKGSHSLATSYVRGHQTSGSRGRPLSVLDTADDWRWWLECWQFVLDAADIQPTDQAVLAFSFGPFIGFWSAFDALVERGVLTLPGGGMSSVARLNLIERSQANVLLCTPTYALHLAEAGIEHGIRVDRLPINKIIVAGETGGSVPAIRNRIEQIWAATVTDHCGATEVGAWGYGDKTGKGLYIIESEFIAEFLSVETGQPAKEGELSQLIITSLGRIGCPVIRYRTGDLVRPRWEHSATNRDGRANQFVYLDGGVLGRADDMMVVRGVNIYPSAVEQILRGFPEVVEYRMTARKRGEMDELLIEVEDHLQQPQRIADELQLRLGLKIEVCLAPAMSLPRTEHKGQRFIDRRNDGQNE